MKKHLFPLLAVALLLLLYLLLFPPRWYLNLTKRVEVSAETGAVRSKPSTWMTPPGAKAKSMR